MTKWHSRYIELAELVSSWSKDPRKQVGAVVTRKYRVLGIGFNGFPSTIADTEQRLHNRELKNKLMIHAEINAIMAAGGSGDTIYVYPCLPCITCLMVILQAGITKVVSSKKFKDRPTQWDKELVCQIAAEHEVEILYV